jgi:hypothetical protein
MIDSITSFFGSIVFAILSTFGVNTGTEQPKYVVVDRIGSNIEIRKYAPRIAAEYTLDTQGSGNPRGDAFRAIAGYIFGANKGRKTLDMTSPVEMKPMGSTKIAMTTPVEMNKSEQQMTMRFFMPAEYKLVDLPVPTNPRIKLIEIPEVIVAALTFSGSTAEESIATETERLLKQIKSSAYQPTGEPTAYLYNPPWTIPFLRRNEVIVSVKKN